MNAPEEQGRVEHYLPRFVLQGFAIDPGRKEPQVFCFRRNRHGYKTNTRNIAGERNFYGIARGVDIEARLSRDEARYAPLVAALRRAPGEAVDQSLVAEFVNHLVSRSKYLRATLAEGIQRSMDSAARVFSESDAVAALRQSSYEKARAHPAVQQLLDRVPSRTRRALEKKLRIITARQDVPDAIASVGAGVNPDKMARDAQKDALLRFLDEPQRGGAMVRLAWAVRVVDAGLILADVGPICRRQGTERLSIIDENMSAIDVVLLPLAPKALLLGLAPDRRYDVGDVDRLNRETAAIARDFFVSSQETAREAQYSALIGTAPTAISSLDFDAMARESLRREFGEPES